MSGLVGETTADTVGIQFEPTTFLVTNDPERITPIGDNTQAVIFRADPNNGGIVYLGFQDDITTGEGIPLQAGEAFSAEININEQPMYGVADTANDTVYGLGSK